MKHDATLSTDETLVWLRDAWSRSRGMSADVRKKLMGICLAYRLRDTTGEQAHSVVDGIVLKLTGRHLPALPVPEVAATEAAVANGGQVALAPAVAGAANVDPHVFDRLRAVAKMLGGTAGEGADFDATVQELENLALRLVDRVYALADKKRFMNTPLEHVLGVIDVRLRHGDEATRHAAQEAFDRLLKSLDPVAIKDNVEEKGLRFGPFHKAALYDAVCEKYAQMNEYHEKGRLVRDFRAMYKTRLSELAKSEGAVE